MITFPKNKVFIGEKANPGEFRTEVNEKKERKLVWVKDRPITRDGESIESARGRIIREKEDEITGTKGYKCNLCGAIHRTKKQPKKCGCEEKPEKVKIETGGVGQFKMPVKSVWCVCLAGHGFRNPLNYPNTGCKKCKQIEHALTPTQQKERDKRYAELKKQNDEHKKRVEEREKYKLRKEYEIKVQEWQVQAQLIAKEIQKLGEKNVQKK